MLRCEKKKVVLGSYNIHAYSLLEFVLLNHKNPLAYRISSKRDKVE